MDDLVQDWSISSALAMKILQPCTKPSKSSKMVFLSLFDTCFLSKTFIVMSYSSFKSDAENAHIYA